MTKSFQAVKSVKAITLGISSKQNNDTNFHFIFVTMNGDDSDNNSLNDNQNDGDDLVPPRRIEFQQKFDATLANAESNYARNSIEMNNFNLMKNFCIQRNVDAIGLEDLMNQPNGNYMRTFIIGIIVSWGVGGIGGKAAEYSSGRGSKGREPEKWRGTNHLRSLCESGLHPSKGDNKYRNAFHQAKSRSGSVRRVEQQRQRSFW